MAKTIKFNLEIDKHLIRDLADLEEHFNVEDLLAAFTNGSLKRWFEARELTEEIKALEKIKSDDAFEIARDLCKLVFKKDCTPEMLAAAVYPFEFWEKQQAKMDKYQAMKDNKAEIIRAYHGSYSKLLEQMEERSGDYYFLKTAAKELHRECAGLFGLDYSAFYQRYIAEHPLVILALIANVEMRKLLPYDFQKIYTELGFSKLTEVQYETTGLLEKFDRGESLDNMEECKNNADTENLRLQSKDIFILKCADNPSLNGHVLCSNKLGKSWYPITYISCGHLKKLSDPHVKTFSGDTQSYWSDIEESGKKYLILKMEKGDFVRNKGKTGEEFSDSDVNGHFLVLDGIDYKSNDASRQLIYMEV